MKVFEFSTWGAYESKNRLFSVTEIEVEEKSKIYIGKGTRINKADIDKVQSSYGNRMFSLSNDSRLYIDKIIEIQKNKIAIQEQRIISQKEELQKWEALKEREKNESRIVFDK